MPGELGGHDGVKLRVLGMITVGEDAEVVEDEDDLTPINPARLCRQVGGCKLVI